jgi:[ribosomal protein S5]-alanine N-acetyltransferase
VTIDAAFDRFPILTTQRLRLRQTELRDADDVYALFSDEEALRFFGSEPFTSLEEAQDLIARRQADYEARKSIRWSIALKDDDRVIGSCGFHHFGESWAEVGYILSRAHWGKGVMPEALSAILTYGFGEMGLHRVEAIIDIDNERSKNLLLKLGFTYEGNLRQRFPLGGQFVDEHYFGLLQNEWHAQ